MTLYHRAADMLEGMTERGMRNSEIYALIAELRAAAQQSALDELVRENERLGLYDDQKPAQETKCACSPDMYVAGYTGGAAPEGLFGKLYVYIEGASRSVEYAPVAAPAPAQPVTDAQPVAWRYRDYVSGCWFVSAEPYPAGSIAGESVPLYLAPAPAQSRQPLSEWIACSDRLPEPEVDVLCCGPNRMDSELPRVMFVDWFGSKPDCGRGVTHWQPLPAAPSSAQSLGESRE